MKLRTNILILLALSGAFIFAPKTDDACATGTGSAIAQQTCDTQVWRTMENRAHLETQREIMQNQNLIFKADSVLNYTCFDRLAAHAARNIGSLFTHTNYFGNRQIIQWNDPNAMHDALNNAVIGALSPYLESNFAHSYLGGRGQHTGLGNVTRVTQPIALGGSASYSCDVMSQVWTVAKCLNFQQVSAFIDDGFHPFIDLNPHAQGEVVQGYSSIDDSRAFPTECSAGISNTTWNNLYHHSRNEEGPGSNNHHYQYGTPVATTFAMARALIMPTIGVIGLQLCGRPIPTGVTVILGSGTGTEERYPDAVCTNPGCSYVRGAGATLGTCRATSQTASPPATPAT